MIGAGMMGADIAGWCVASGMEVSLQDMNAGADRQGHRGAEEAVRPQVQDQGRCATRRKARLIADPKGDNIGRADVVIEAIVEKLEVKQNLFKSIEGRLKPGAVLATNTSSHHDRGYRRAAGRSGPADRHPLLQSGRADAAGRGDAGRTRRATKR